MLLSDSLLPTIHTVYSGASSPSVVGGSTIGLAPSTTCVPPPLNASTSTPRSSSLSQLSSAGISSETQRGGVQEQENREAAPNIPTQLCTYYAKGINGVGQGCLRVNCKFFHGTEEMLEELWKGAGEAAPLSGDGENEADERVRPAILNMNLGDKKPIVCLAYLSNSCRRPGCRFLHLPSNVRPLPIAVCECFTRGSCTRKRCRFFHGPKELLSKMHAQGVTMYNPSTNEPYDPSSSLDELMRLQERTTVPLSALPQPPQFFSMCLPPPPLSPQGNMLAYHSSLSSTHMPACMGAPSAGAQAPFTGQTTVGLFPQTHSGYQHQQAVMPQAATTATHFTFAAVHQMGQHGNSSAPFHASIPSPNVQQQQQHGQSMGSYIVQYDSNCLSNNRANNSPFSFYTTDSSVPPSAPQQLQSMPAVNYLVDTDRRSHMQQLIGHAIGGNASHIGMVPNSAGQVLSGSHYYHHLEQQQHQSQYQHQQVMGSAQNAFSTMANPALQQQMYAPQVHTSESLPSLQLHTQATPLYSNLNNVGTAQLMLQAAAGTSQMPQYRL